MKFTLLAGGLGAALLTTSALAQPGPFGPPPYKEQPSKADLAASVPPEAAQKGVDGVAAAMCKVTPEGALEGCKLVQEVPLGFGFGAALLSLAPKYRLAPKFPAPGGMFRLQQRFDAPKSRYATRLLVGKPVWEAAPSAADVGRAFAGLPAGSTPGEVLFRCDEDSKALKNCELLKGSPAYEAAARPLLEKFRLGGPKRGGVVLGTSLLTQQHQQTDRPYLYLAVALEPPAKADEGYLLDPEWLAGPTPDQVKAAFPAKAAAAGVQQGQGGVDCRLDSSGHTTDCRVVGEDPKDMGFGAAALSLAPQMAVNPWTEDGHSIEGVRVQFALGFKK